MLYYTSINLAYLPKARVLAKTLKAHNQNAYFILLLCEEIPEYLIPEQEPFDEIITIFDLALPVSNLKQWMYMHNITELATAVKGQALLNFLGRSDKVVYLDPDIMVFHDLSELEQLLDTFSVVVTPHQLVPDSDTVAIEGDEIGSLLRGTYNFGFYAANNSNEGKHFATWFRDRLLHYCYDEVENGLFTDQKWGNLVPAMFNNVCIWRNPGCNVSTWNLCNRKVTQDKDGVYSVNGVPLVFFHFSGIDSGAQKAMVDLFGGGNPLLYKLRDSYLSLCDQNEQKKYESYKYKYNYYNDGKKIQEHERRILRHRPDVIEYFSGTDPFDKETAPSYYHWYLANKACYPTTAEAVQLEQLLNSRSWQLTKPLRMFGNLARKMRKLFK